MGSQPDEEDLARRRIRREERGVSTAEEDQALEWLATRLRKNDVVLPGRMSDWHTAEVWDSSHWPKLKAALQDIDARDQTVIDRTFEDYSRKNGLLIDVKPAETQRTTAGGSIGQKRLYF